MIYQKILPLQPLQSLYGEVADKRIPVTARVREDLSDLKAPDKTFAQLLSDMIEHEKKRLLFLSMEKIEKEGKFVGLPL